MMTFVQKIAVWVIPLIFAITLHEVAHGWVASRFGDQTAKIMGRLTVNPIKHIDPIGTIVLPIILLVLGNFIFGWAKPVPVSPVNFKQPRLMMALVALAGPIANLLMMLFWAIILKLALLGWQQQNYNWIVPVVLMAKVGVFLNLWLALLNLLPIPPLDGGRILSNILPPKLSYYFDRLELYGLIIIIALLASGVLSHILVPLLRYSLALVYALFHIQGV
ncbi:MAG: site-2 protease family protein [Gammaproteobacteria bacterium]|nr:site-2 protease family protein [Gammaproteobacteria bacterium]